MLLPTNSARTGHVNVMGEAIVDLTAKTYEIARLIPVGQVTSYGELPLPLPLNRLWLARWDAKSKAWPS